METKVNFAWPVTLVQYEDYKGLLDCISANKTVWKEKRLCIFGAGIRGSMFGAILEKNGIYDFCFTDNNADKWGGCMNSHPIIPITELKKQMETTMVLLSIENGKDVEKQLEEIGYRKNQTYFSIETNLYERYVEEFQRKVEPNLLFMGDCGLSQISIDDTQQENLADMLRRELDESTTKVLAMHGMGMRAYYHIFHAQLELGMKPRTLIFMVNLEAFTKKHHVLPRTQHAELIEKLCAVFSYPNEELQEYAELTRQRSAQLQLDVFSAAPVEAEENARLIMQMNYMYSLSEKTEDAQYLVKILQLAKQEGVRLLPFIPPVNYEYAQTLFGESFLKKYNANITKIKNIIGQEDTEVLDLSFLLQSHHFAQKKTIDETANYEGRNRIMEALITELKRKKYME